MGGAAFIPYAKTTSCKCHEVIMEAGTQEQCIVILISVCSLGLLDSNLMPIVP